MLGGHSDLMCTVPRLNVGTIIRWGPFRRCSMDTLAQRMCNILHRKLRHKLNSISRRLFARALKVTITTRFRTHQILSPSGEEILEMRADWHPVDNARK